MMSNYPQWWNTDITVYNKYVNPITNVVSWYKTNLTDCFWSYSHDKLIVNNTVIESNSVICRIPQNENFRERYIWVNYPNDTMGNYFTLGIGDMIVKGNVSDVIDEYTTGMRSTDFLKKYKNLQGVIVVEELQINVGGGRNNPHYLIKGS